MAVGDLSHAPAALPQEKTRYPLYRKLGGPHDQFGQMRKISPPSRFDPRTVQPWANRYTELAIPAPNDDYIFKQHLLLLKTCHMFRILNKCHHHPVTKNTRDNKRFIYKTFLIKKAGTTLGLTEIHIDILTCTIQLCYSANQYTTFDNSLNTVTFYFV